MQLDAILMKKPTEEVRRWDREPALMEVGKRHCLTGLREREDIPGGSPPPGDLLWKKKAFLHQPQQPHLHHLRRYQLTHLAVQEDSGAAMVELAEDGRYSVP